MPNDELPIIQKTYDLILWYIPHVNKMPRNHRFGLGDRITTMLYRVLEGLIRARFAKNKVEILRSLNVEIEILRFQTRLMRDFQIFSNRQYEFATRHLNEIGAMMGGWIKQQGRK